MSEIKQLGKAIFNMQKFQIFQAKINPSTTHTVSDSYAFAWDRSVFPLFQEGDLHGDLEPYFKITKTQVNEVSKKADLDWRNNQCLTFYQYETFFHIREKGDFGLDRWALMSIFRYMFLERAFNENFWNTLLSPMEHPTEAASITRTFDLEDLFGFV